MEGLLRKLGVYVLGNVPQEVFKQVSDRVSFTRDSSSSPKSKTESGTLGLFGDSGTNMVVTCYRDLRGPF